MLAFPSCTDIRAPDNPEIYIFVDLRHEPARCSASTGPDVARHPPFLGWAPTRRRDPGNAVRVSAWLGLAARGDGRRGRGPAGVIGFFWVRTSRIPFLLLTLAFSQLVFSVALEMAST